jgi:hypothetical protein
VETPTEMFECIANYLGEKRLLEKEFRYFQQDYVLECNPFIAEIRENWVNDTIREMFFDAEAEVDDDEEMSHVESSILGNWECYYNTLLKARFPENIMKKYIYTKSNKLSRAQKDWFLNAVKNDITMNFVLCLETCESDFMGARFFKNIFEVQDVKNKPLYDQQSEYCVRKYVIESEDYANDELVKRIKLNPDNLDVNFDCTDYIADFFDEFYDGMKMDFRTQCRQPKKEIRCFNKKLESSEHKKVRAKVFALRKVDLSEQEKSALKNEHITSRKAIYNELLECFI